MLPKSYKDYTLIWRATLDDYGGLFWTEIFILQKGYFKMGYFLEEGVVMLVDGALTVYYSPREYKIGGERGLKFYRDKQNIKNMFQLFSDGIKRIKDLEKHLKATKLSDCSNQELLALWKEMVMAIKTYIDAYFYNEPQFLWRMEEMIKAHIAKYESDQEKQIQIFSLLLSPPKNSKDKKAIEQHRILKDLKFPSELVQFIFAIQRSGTERFEIKKHERKISAIRIPLLMEAARRAHLSVSQLHALYFTELRNLLLKNKTPNLTEVNERAKSYFLYMRKRNGQVQVTALYGDKAKKEAGALTKTVFGSTGKSLKGETAFPGKVRGKARVFPYFGLQKDLAKHMKTMIDKEVLVAVHTTPQMVPVVFKASAIVTDEAGINGHAAIISREFKIPCVIGTGNGTERIKTGMKLEVDATKGEVTIIDN